jgi:hypothetical protein
VRAAQQGGVWGAQQGPGSTRQSLFLIEDKNLYHQILHIKNLELILF